MLLFDVLVGNPDRHPKNFLVHQPTNSLVAIDHGYLWIEWPPYQGCGTVEEADLPVLENVSSHWRDLLNLPHFTATDADFLRNTADTILLGRHLHMENPFSLQGNFPPKPLYFQRRS